MSASRVETARRKSGPAARGTSGTSSRQVSARRGRSAAPAKPAAPARPAPPRPKKLPAGRLPGWGDLAVTPNSPTPAAVRQPRKATARHGWFDRVASPRVMLVLVLACLAGLFYVNHVYATQDLAARAQTLRKQNTRLHLKHDRLRGEFDRLHGPSVILERARQIGLVESAAYAPTIRME
jgi:cell division protein FtsB